MGQAACRPACERRKRTRSSDQAQGAKAYGGREATATRIPHHKPTKPERKQNKTKQTKGEPRLGPPVRPSAARPDSQPHPHPLLVCAPSSRQPDNQPPPPPPPGLHAPSRGREHYQAPAGRLIATAIARQRPPCRPARTRVSPTPDRTQQSASALGGDYSALPSGVRTSSDQIEVINREEHA